MSSVLAPRATRKAIPIVLLNEEKLKSWAKQQPIHVVNWLNTHEFKAEAGTFCVLPDVKGKPGAVVAGISSPPSLWDLADLPRRLPKGTYSLDWDGPISYQEWLTLGWVLGSYNFSRYKKPKKDFSAIVIPEKADQNKIMRYAEAISCARDLINTPAEDMGPAQLAAAVVSAGKKYGAKVTQIIGEDLIKKNYPAVHAVGRASSRPPRLVTLVWGNQKHPTVTLVGKGVCFDTGGLDLKSSGNMYLMKKDMGGAACALAVTMMIMAAKLPVRVRLIIPAVENSVSGNAYRPSDVIKMRNGLTVEVGNTDAEGRLILADALAEASSEKPSMIIDFSTLTGAARTAVGTEMAAFFTNQDDLAEQFMRAGADMEDSLWRLPLYASYKKMLDSSIADLNSAPGSPYAGAITAALFLERFVGKNIPWIHLDFMAWNLTSKPGRPEGGEAATVRAVYRLIEEKTRKS